MKSVIETHDLCKSYHGHSVVDHLNLIVPEEIGRASGRERV